MLVVPNRAHLGETSLLLDDQVRKVQILKAWTPETFYTVGHDDQEVFCAHDVHGHGVYHQQRGQLSWTRGPATTQRAEQSSASGARAAKSSQSN